MLVSAQSPAEYFSVRDDRSAAYSHAPLVDEIGVTALELQASLARAGKLRAAGPIDPVIAATAVTHGLTILHYDSDFEILAMADARLAHQWVVPRGSVD